MSLLKTLEDVLARIESERQCPREALRRAEELSDEFSDIKPKNEMPTPEQLMGLPPDPSKTIRFRSTPQNAPADTPLCRPH